MDIASQTGREDRIVEWCAAYIGKALNMDPAEIGPDDEIERFGLDSAITTSMIIEMEQWLETEIPPALLFEQSTLRGIASAVVGRLG